MAAIEDEEEIFNDLEDEYGAMTCSCCALPPSLAAIGKPIEVDELEGISPHLGLLFLRPLLFPNTKSDCRDHCANERTLLSHLRLSTTMAVIAAAIVLPFHFESHPSPTELARAKLIGLLLWVLSLMALGVGLGNYLKTINRYSRRMAIVQTGWKTQMIMAILTLGIFGTCVVLLVMDKLPPRSK